MTKRDDFQAMWAAEAARTNAEVGLNRRRLHALAVQPNLSRARWTSWLQLGFDVVAILWLGSFAYDHVAEARFFSPALLLFVAAIALLQVHIRSIIDATPTNFAEPVLVLQKRLEQLRLRETTTTRSIFALCWLAWTPLLIVLAKAVGFDAYRMGTAYLLANIAFGIGAGMLVGWMFRKRGDSRIARALDGTAAREARAALAKIAEYDREPSK